MTDQRARSIRPPLRRQAPRAFPTNGLTPESRAELLAAIQIEYDQELMVEGRWRREHERQSSRAYVPSSGVLPVLRSQIGTLKMSII